MGGFKGRINIKMNGSMQLCTHVVVVTSVEGTVSLFWACLNFGASSGEFYGFLLNHLSIKANTIH